VHLHKPLASVAMIKTAVAIRRIRTCSPFRSIRSGAEGAPVSGATEHLIDEGEDVERRHAAPRSSAVEASSWSLSLARARAARARGGSNRP
jgi:hypothetical protein